MEHQDGNARIRPGSIDGETKLANVPILRLYFRDGLVEFAKGVMKSIVIRGASMNALAFPERRG
jgi:hypothetical protein